MIKIVEKYLKDNNITINDKTLISNSGDDIVNKIYFHNKVLGVNILKVLDVKNIRQINTNTVIYLDDEKNYVEGIHMGANFIRHYDKFNKLMFFKYANRIGYIQSDFFYSEDNMLYRTCFKTHKTYYQDVILNLSLSEFKEIYNSRIDIKDFIINSNQYHMRNKAFHRFDNGVIENRNDVYLRNYNQQDVELNDRFYYTNLYMNNILDLNNDL